MGIHKEQLYRSVKGSLMENEDWWWLCYDDEAERFYVEHEWDRVNAYKLSDPANVGKAVLELDAYDGPGKDKIEEAKQTLIGRARRPS
jgi:hypothetical protein